MDDEELPTQERNGIVFVYYDPEKKPPAFAVPEIPQFVSGQFSDYYRLSWKVRGHIEEIAENAVDYSHFVELHIYKEIPTVDAFEMDGHNFRIVLRSQRICVGGLMETHTDIKFHGGLTGECRYLEPCCGYDTNTHRRGIYRNKSFYTS